jgi:hypothetical protein
MTPMYTCSCWPTNNTWLWIFSPSTVEESQLLD